MPEKKTSTILVIDDDKSVIDSYKLLLGKEQWNIFTATNSDKALSTITAFQIDIVVMDLKLGEESGLDIGEMIMKRSPATRVILLTAYPTFEIAIEATKRGFFYFLEKSTPTEIILDKIREAARIGETSGKELSELKQKNCLRFITICKHSLITDQIRKISEDNLCLDYSKNFKAIKDIVRTGFQKETDLAMICASCIFTSLEDSARSIKEIYTLFPFIKIIVINENFNNDEKAKFLKMGIKGFFNSEMNSAEIEKALLVIRDGGIWAERKILNLAIEPDITQISRILSNYDKSYNLSRREKEILKTMVLGIRNRDIADRLFISEKTVKTHINRIFKKLGVDSRVKAILKAKEENLV
ncbi:MAG: response regulator [Acidobacteriota bacterium]